MAELSLAHSLVENTREAGRITDCGRCAQCTMAVFAGVGACAASCDGARIAGWWASDPCCTRSVLHWWGTSGTDHKVGGSPTRPRSGLLVPEESGDYSPFTPAKDGDAQAGPGDVSMTDAGGPSTPSAGGDTCETGAEVKQSPSQDDTGMDHSERGESASPDAEPSTPPKESE